MRITTVFLLLGCMHLSAASLSQTITLSAKRQSIQQVFEIVEKQTGYWIIYSDQLVKSVKPIAIEATNMPLATFLNRILTPRKLTYAIDGKNILIMAEGDPLMKNKEASKVLTSEDVVLQQVIRGTVKDEQGTPLEGVTVALKGATNVTTTNGDGNFQITVESTDNVLVFTAVGFEPQEVVSNKQSSIDIVLKSTVSDLSEVVVVGYGTQKKTNLTGAVAVVTGDELVNKPVTGTVDALQGIVPGLVVTKSSGSPGRENYNIQIRGVTSATNNPVLVLVDGTEGNIDDVRPEDVESISVLKDAASAAIYGAKAAGGVILVTTKSGKSGKISTDYNTHFTFAKLGRLQNRISSYQAALMRNEAEINAGGSAPLSDDDLAKLADPNFLWDADPANPNRFRYWGDYDYKELVLKPFTPMMSHNVAIGGGTEKTTFRLSGTYYRNSGSIKIGPDDNTRYAGRLNLNTQIGKYLELSNVFSYSNNQIEKPWQNLDGDYGFWAYVFTYPGVTPLRDPNGHLAQGVRVGTFDGRIKFYQYDYDHGFQSWNEHNVRANSTLTIKNLVENLQFRVIGGIDANFDETFHHSMAIEDYGIDETVLGYLTGTNMTRGQANASLKELQLLGDYNFKAGNHGLSLLGGYSLQDYRYYYFEGYIQDLVNENLPSFDWASRDNMRLTDDAASYRYQSFFGRAQYNYHDRYLLETNIRYDGSSKLNPDDRYRLFPSVSAAWRISQENWFNLGYINELKLRGSFGQLGNANAIGNYDYIPLLLVNEDLLLGSNAGEEQRAQYVYQDRLSSRNITWETVETSNIGFEVGLFHNRLTVEWDYYVKRNKNMLAAVAYPSVLGIGVGNQNVGELKTWGWEANLGWKDRKGRVNYWINANIGDSENELVEYYGATIIGEGTRRLVEGYPINSIFGYKTDGLFQTQEEVDNHVFQNTKTGPGDVRYVNLNNDDIISAGSQTEEDHGDLVYLGNNNPRYNFGIRGGFNWKGLDFSMFLQGVGRRVFMLDQQYIMPYSYGEFGPQEHNLDYWREDNRDAFWPRLMVGGTHNFMASDKWIQDAAYIRLKDIQLGYTISNQLLSRVGVTKLRFYVAGRDVWEATKVFDFIDPEMPNQASYQYPFRRSYTIGLNLNF